MQFVLGLVLGAVLGVIVERLLGYPLDRLILDPLTRRRSQQQARKMNESYSVQGELLVIGESAIFVNQFFPVGIASESISGHVSRVPTTLDERLRESTGMHGRVSVSRVEAAIVEWKERLESEPHAWNGDSLALERCAVGRVPTTEEPVISMWFRESDYATARAVEQFWMGVAQSERRSLSGEALRDVDPFLCNAFGLNCTVETADGLVLVAKRGRNARGWSGYWHTSFNEGLSVADTRPGGIVDIVAAFGRGLDEELGLDPRAVPNFRERLSIHSLILDVDTYQWGLLAHLDLAGTEFTSSVVRGMRNLGAAPDDWEASDIRFIEFAGGTHEVLHEIDQAQGWVPHGLLNVALSAIVRHPSQARELRSALLRAHERGTTKD